MSDRLAPELGLVRASGQPHDIGLALGRAGRVAVHERLLALDYWRAVTDSRHQPLVAALAERTQARFPAIHAELQGLAEGLGLPFLQVMAWNCRGDLMSNVPDGCTTVQLPGAVPVIAHNEDGLPELRGSCFIADISGANGNGFVACCYPGSLPGHTFAVTTSGIAQAVNNLRLRDVHPEIPRMVLGRAILECRTVAEALALLSGENRCGGFHFTLAQSGEGILHSVEFGGGGFSHRQITRPSAHANHALHLPLAQMTTRSSADRQRRADLLLAAGETAPLRILRDAGGPGLPIHRSQSDDPDHENTLATAVISVERGAISWEFHDQISTAPVHAGNSAAR